MGIAGMAWKIRVRFGGKSLVKQYTTPDIRSNDPGWGDEIFHNGIESLEFFLPTGHRLVLAGMEKYNFFVEAVEDLGRRGKASIEAFWFLGKIPGKDLTECIRISEGCIERVRHKHGCEWGGTPTRGWKKGIIGGTVLCSVLNGHG